eukprot:TRINITY_DN2457_c0_g3_i3.p2 TRINITY_DN2457_c0_g3~~TRINITY_DN2457_c0_g3_i3.p2  ORF type:complete len:326 (+),score=132.77 TRINITY_DN2457_c0_g3_i3:121-978(+)
MSVVTGENGVISFIRFSEQDVRDDVCEMMTISPEAKGSVFLDEKEEVNPVAMFKKMDAKRKTQQAAAVKQANSNQSTSGGKANGQQGKGSKGGQGGQGGQGAGGKAGGKKKMTMITFDEAETLKRASQADNEGLFAKKEVLFVDEYDQSSSGQSSSNSNTTTTETKGKADDGGKGNDADESSGKMSQLSVAIKETTKKSSIPKFFNEPAIREGERLHKVQVFLAFTEGESVVISVPDSTAVGQGIGMAVVAAMKKEIPNMVPHLDAYILRLAEKDGTIEDDFPRK